MDTIIATTENKTLQFINAVKANSLFYDKFCTDFKDRQKKWLTWEELAAKFQYKDGRDAKQKFRSLRDRYIRIRRKSQCGESSDAAKWPYYSAMSFLNGHEKRSSRESNSRQQQYESVDPYWDTDAGNDALCELRDDGENDGNANMEMEMKMEMKEMMRPFTMMTSTSTPVPTTSPQLNCIKKMEPQNRKRQFKAEFTTNKSNNSTREEAFFATEDAKILESLNGSIISMHSNSKEKEAPATDSVNDLFGRFVARKLDEFPSIFASLAQSQIMQVLNNISQQLNNAD